MASSKDYILYMRVETCKVVHKVLSCTQSLETQYRLEILTEAPISQIVWLKYRMPSFPAKWVSITVVLSHNVTLPKKWFNGWNSLVI